MAAVFWGTYMVPFKKSGSSNLIQFQVIMALGIFLSALFITPILGYELNINFFGILSGIIWGVGNIMTLSAVTHLGLSKTMPILSGVVIVGSFLWGVIFFNELSEILTGLAGIILIVSGIVIVTGKDESKSKSFKKGLMYALLAGFLFSFQLVPIKFAALTPSVSFFPICLGILFFAVIYAIFKKIKFEREAMVSSLFSGIIWNIGNLFGIIAVSSIGLSKGLPITQLSILIAVCWGLFFFKEVSSNNQKVKIFIGAIILLLGVFILSIA